MTGWQVSGERRTVNGEQFTTTTFLVTVAGLLGGAICALLAPWAVVHSELGGVGLAAALVFLTFSGLGFVYAWRRGDPDWDPEEISERDSSTQR